MKYFTICHLLFLICGLSIGVLGQYTKAPNCSVDAFEASFVRAYGHFGNDNIRLPTNPDELQHYCNEVMDNKEFSKDFGERCLTGTAQTLLKLQVYNVERVNKQFCARNGKKRDAFIAWSKCGNDAKPATKQCWNDMVNDIASAREVANVKAKIPIVCCKYYTWISCMKEAWKSTPSCTDDAREGYAKVIQKATVESMNLICNRYKNDDEMCAKFLAQLPQKKHDTLRETPISYTFDIFESLPA